MEGGDILWQLQQVPPDEDPEERERGLRGKGVNSPPSPSAPLTGRADKG